MALTKIKTDHPFTKAQLHALNKELKKISNVEIVALRGVSLPGKSNFIDIQILHSPFSLDVFLYFTDITISDQPKTELYKIDTNGQVDYKPRSTMKFNNLADRVTYFNSLQTVNFK